MTFTDDFFALVSARKFGFGRVRGCLVFTETALYQMVYESGGHAVADAYIEDHIEASLRNGRAEPTRWQLTGSATRPAEVYDKKAYAKWFFSLLDSYANDPIDGVIDAIPVIGGELYRVIADTRGGEHCAYNGDFVGSVDAGVIDGDGQWIGDISDIESAVRGRFPMINQDAVWVHR